MNAADLATLVRTHSGALVNRTWTLPIVAVSPTSRCHSRCQSCDWWRTDGSGDLGLDDYRRLAAELEALGTRLVVLTGGEPLLRDDLWDIASQFTSRRMVLHLLTSGLALRTQAAEVARHCAQVVISLDAPNAEAYAVIRGVNGFGAVERGVARLRELAPRVRVTARATLHAANFRAVPDLIDAARRLRVDRISFLAADLSSPAFGPRQHEVTAARLRLSPAEIREFHRVIDAAIASRADDFTSGFVAESPARLHGLADHYAACLGDMPFPAGRCNAPAVSVVIDADGTVRPCFFHAGLGNIHQRTLRQIVTTDLPRFRAAWRPSEDPTCARCVCRLNVGWRTPPWA